MNKWLAMRLNLQLRCMSALKNSGTLVTKMPLPTATNKAVGDSKRGMASRNPWGMG